MLNQILQLFQKKQSPELEEVPKWDLGNLDERFKFALEVLYHVDAIYQECTPDELGKITLKVMRQLKGNMNHSKEDAIYQLASSWRFVDKVDFKK